MKEATSSQKPARWTETDDNALIEVIRNLHAQGKPHTAKLWGDVTAEMKSRGLGKTELACKNRWSRKLWEQTRMDERKPRKGDRKSSTCHWNPRARKKSNQEMKAKAKAAKEALAQEKVEGLEGEGGDKTWRDHEGALTEEERAAYTLMRLNREDAALGNCPQS